MVTRGARKGQRQWGHTLVTEPSQVRWLSRAVISGPQVADIADDLGYTAPFAAGGDQVQGRVAGYRGPTPVHTLMLRLLVSAADYPRLPGSPWNPTADRIRALAHQWHDILRPVAVGKGAHVERVLRAHLWYPPLATDQLYADLRAADAADQTAAADQAARRQEWMAARKLAKGVTPSTMLAAAPIPTGEPVWDLSSL